MNFKFLILSTGAASLIIVLVAVFLMDSFDDVSYEGISITLFSDYDFQKYANEHQDNLNIVDITDDDLKSVPKIKDLISKSLQKELSSDQSNDSQSTSTQVFASLKTDEIKTYHKWGNEFGLSSGGRSMISGSIIKYDDQYYKLSFTIA
jgi:hypothetical protein